MDQHKQDHSGKQPRDRHQPTVTRSDLYDRGELVLKDSVQADRHFKTLKKALKKLKKQLKKQQKKAGVKNGS